MLDNLYLVTSVNINEQIYTIRNKADWRIILSTLSMLQDAELDDDTKSLSLFIMAFEEFSSYEDLLLHQNNLLELSEWFFRFICQFEEPNEAKLGANLYDWETDFNLIIAPINRVINSEIREMEYMHWWTFLGAFAEIGECLFSTVVSIRSKQNKKQKLEKWEATFVKEHKHLFKKRVVNDKATEEFLKKWGLK
ncbi:MAG: hypothetical protein ATN36_06610 [Epulopiscium sp. Nele67-Bin005]|nr:MAG: hypothetical protein ATN36_06610 [Epulopiscium sp. Nele67-Bin005]